MTKKLKKDIIADAAFSCFLASGYGATSVDEIVKASGVSKGGIYWHFKSKEDIFLYLVERWINEWYNRYIANIQHLDSASEKLTLFVEQRIKDVDTPITALMLEFLLQTKENITVHKMNNEFNKSAKILYEIIDEGIRRGEFKPLDSKTAMLTFLGMIDGVGLQFLVHKDKQQLETTLRTTLAIFLAGVSA